MVLPPIPNFPQIPCCTLQTVPACPEAPVAVLETARDKEAELRVLAEALGPKLVVPEVWRDLLPHAGILISSSISGGTLKNRFDEAIRTAPRRCWLLLEQMQMEFPLPCPDGTGRRITVINYGNSFYSEALCCQYTHFCCNHKGFMVLWDTRETLLTKLELARAIGFQGYVDFTVQKDEKSL